VSKKENYILETFLRLTNRTYPYGAEDTLVESMISQGVFPDLEKDSHGNYYYKIGKSRTIFASHLDTACKEATPVTHVFDGNMIKTDGKTILGADDKAGVTILLHLIKNKIPGLYYFFIGEEVGCIGSGLAAKYDKFKGLYDRIISFDRRDTGSVITFQSSSRCCSDAFADELSKQLNKRGGMSYKKDDGGVYTDSAEFTHLIPECTNISVGYYKEHTTNESQDIKHLAKLADACLLIDWENLPTRRDPSKTEYKSYNYGSYGTKSYGKSGNNWRAKGSNWRSRDYGYHDDWYDGPKDDLEDDLEEDWPGEKEYASFKKTRRSGKKYFDNGSGLIDITPKSVDKKEDYYDSIIDKILDKNLSKLELDVVKDQYLDMNNVNDKTFYDYLLGNVID
jgi:hypothetical protein